MGQRPRRCFYAEVIIYILEELFIRLPVHVLGRGHSRSLAVLLRNNNRLCIAPDHASTGVPFNALQIQHYIASLVLCDEEHI